MTSEDTPKSTCSPESAAGPGPCDSPGGQRTAPSGPAPVPVSRFRALDSGEELPTDATSGPLVSASSPSAALQWSLKSRLRRALDVNGSPEYELTWKRWDMQSGPPICQLRASARRTSVSDSGGWPTPRRSDGDKNVRTGQGAEQEAGRRSPTNDLATATQTLTGWPSPTGSTGGPEPEGPTGRKLSTVVGWATPRAGPGHSSGNPDRAANHNSRLEDQVYLSGWRTPASADAKGSAKSPQDAYLPDQVALAGWATPQAMVSMTVYF